MRLAFFVQHLLCGGVEKALLTLTKRLAQKGHDITIYVIVRTGDLIDSVPSNVKLAEIPMSSDTRRFLPVGGTKMAVRRDLSSHHYGMALRHLLSHKFGSYGFAELNVDFDKIPHLPDRYDIAVNYHLHSPFLVRYLSEKVTADLKYAWIHNDFATTGYDIAKLDEFLHCCNRFFAVSQTLADEFIGILPEYKDKTQVALNLVPTEEILEKAEAFTPEEYTEADDRLCLLSAGRLEEQKGYDITIEVCKKLADAGLKFKWFILGEGSLHKKLEARINQLHLQEFIELLGVRLNPYPYFKNCDIYVQTSRHEGYVTTVTEAKIFNRPIVCTDVAGARQQLADKVTGEIACISADDIADRVSSIIKDKSLRDRYTKALSDDRSSYSEDWLKFFEPDYKESR